MRRAVTGRTAPRVSSRKVLNCPLMATEYCPGSVCADVILSAIQHCDADEQHAKATNNIEKKMKVWRPDQPVGRHDPARRVPAAGRDDALAVLVVHQAHAV